MPQTSYQIIKDAAAGTVTTQVGAKGLMSPEQAEHFIDMAFPEIPLSQHVRMEKRNVPKGEIQKMTIKPRIMRRKKEAEWDGHLTTPDFDSVSYDCQAVRVDADISQEFYDTNIEKEGGADRIVELIAKQVNVDREDLCLNGDEDYTGAEDKEFITLNDGWVKQIMNSGHVVQATGDAVSKFDINMFYRIRRAIPSKYITPEFRWIMSPNTISGWSEYLLSQASKAGGIVTDEALKNPGGYGMIPAPSLKDGTILFCNPKNLVMVTTYNIRLRDTTEGVTAMRKDIHAFSTFIETDSIIEETDATAIYTGFNPFPDEQATGGLAA